MSIFKTLADSFNNFISSALSTDNDPPPSTSDRDRAMESNPIGSSVSNERVAYKLKGYFDLAKEQIDKAVRAEEWGLIEDAVAHYRNAERVLLEAKATRAPSLISSRQQKTNLPPFPLFSFLSSVRFALLLHFD